MKQWSLVFVLTAALLVLAGCVGVTSLGVWDAGVPDEELCTIEIWNDLRVTMFDTSMVSWSADFFSNRAVIQIPSGVHTLTLMWTTSESYNSGDTQYTNTYEHARPYQQEFIRGHTYRITRQTGWLFLEFDPVITDITRR
jgi:hypothetical protein